MAIRETKRIDLLISIFPNMGPPLIKFDLLHEQNIATIDSSLDRKTSMSHLSDEATAKFQKDGYLSPLPALEPAEAAEYRYLLEEIERKAGDNVRAARGALPITYQWAWDLVHDKRIVNPLMDVLGPNVLFWSMDWFIKEPGPGFVSYHQDANYWGLEPHNVVTAWVALSDASASTGPMKFIPGSHRGELYDQDDTFEENNLLSRGQRVRTQIDETKACLAPLSTGQMSLHHVRIIHGSEPNLTNDCRIGMVLRYCATDVRQTKVDGDRAILVAGEDTYQHFSYIPRPETDGGDAERALGRAHGQTRHKALMND